MGDPITRLASAVLLLRRVRAEERLPCDEGRQFELDDDIDAFLAINAPSTATGGATVAATCVCPFPRTHCPGCSNAMCSACLGVTSATPEASK